MCYWVSDNEYIDADGTRWRHDGNGGAYGWTRLPDEVNPDVVLTQNATAKVAGWVGG